MEYRALGKIGVAVSRLCFGTLTIGPTQASLPLEEGARVIAHAIGRGITFFDTAQLYGTYPYLRRAMDITGKHDIVISTKTYAHTRELAAIALDEARRELNRDVIDIFLLHEQESEHTLRGHREALDYLLEQKARGVIRAVGASTHRVAAVTTAPAFGLDVIHPLLNLTGIGIGDGSRAEMEQAVAVAHKSGIGVFSMKSLGGGNLFRRAEECFDYAFSLPYVDSVAVGMQHIREVDANIGYFENKRFSPEAAAFLSGRTRRLHIEDWCEGCGSCVARCGQNALSLRDGAAVCDHSRCVICGYCASVCPGWSIKVI